MNTEPDMLYFDNALVTLSYEIMPSWDVDYDPTTKEDFEQFMVSWEDKKFRRKLSKKLLAHPSWTAWLYGSNQSKDDWNIKVRAMIRDVDNETHAIAIAKEEDFLHPNDCLMYYDNVGFPVVKYDSRALNMQLVIEQSDTVKTKIVEKS